MIGRKLHAFVGRNVGVEGGDVMTFGVPSTQPEFDYVFELCLPGVQPMGVLIQGGGVVMAREPPPKKNIPLRGGRGGFLFYWGLLLSTWGYNAVH